MQEVEEAAILLGASGDGGPHPFVVALPNFAARALRDFAIDDAVSHLLFRVVIGRFNAHLEHEAEVVLRHVVT